MIDLVAECRGASSIGITGHTNPDGDCVGSVMALWQFLKKAIPQAQVDVMLEKPASIFDFIKGVSEIVTDYTRDMVYDVMIVADSGPDRTGQAEQYVKTAKKVINIDHHVSNPGAGDVNEMQPKASSAAEVIYELIASKDEYRALIDKEMAQTLYIGIIHDSGVLQYSNTSPKTLRIVADLIGYGFDFPRLIDETFYERTQVESKILGKALVDAYPCLDGTCMVAVLNRETMEAYGAEKKDLSGIVNELRIIKGVQVAVFLYETEPDVYKVSLRSGSDEMDVARVVAHFGGGGHVRAAGCTIQGKPEEIVDSVIEQIALLLEDGR